MDIVFKLIVSIILICVILIILDYVNLNNIEGYSDRRFDNETISHRWGDSRGFAYLGSLRDPVTNLMVNSEHPDAFGNYLLGKGKLEKYGPKRVLDDTDSDISYMNTIG